VPADGRQPGGSAYDHPVPSTSVEAAWLQRQPVYRTLCTEYSGEEQAHLPSLSEAG